MKFKKWVALFLILALAVPAAGCDNGDEEEAEAAVSVLVAQAEQGLISRANVLSGTVAPRAEVQVVPKMAGKVASVTVDIGDRVQAGQTLLRFDAPETAAQLRQAQAGVSAARSTLEQARLNLQQAEKEYERAKNLYEQDIIAESELEKAELNYKIARDQAQESSRAQLEQAEGQLEAAQISRDNIVLTAPLSGFVAARNVDPGEMASQSQPSFSIVDIDTVRIDIQAAEKQINRIRSGQEVTVWVDAAGEETRTGRVTRIAPAADPQTKKYTVRVELDNPGQLLKPGMFAEVDFSTADDVQVIVPRDAVFQQDGVDGLFVFAEGKVEYREVEVGPSDGVSIAVVEGLEAGEMVVVSGQEVLEDGDEVEATELED